jgi:RNA polymerase sigma-70 factor (ECF subfamily)
MPEPIADIGAVDDSELATRPPSERMQQLDAARLPEHFDRLYRAAYGLCRSREDAEDLVQETFERVLRRPRFMRDGRDLAYLMRVMRNVWISNYRSRVRGPVVDPSGEIEYVVDPHGDPSIHALEMRALYDAIGQLSDTYRETIVAVDIVGLSYKEAAHALDTPVGTIMSRLFRARDKVAEAIGVPPDE